MSDDMSLLLRAMLLYPGDVYLQVEWCRAVRLVRSTSHGWLLDRVPACSTSPTSDTCMDSSTTNIVNLAARRLS